MSGPSFSDGIAFERALGGALELLRPETAPWGWERDARPEQLPPPGEWFVWLIMAGRGWGKTRTGAEWLAREAQSHPGLNYAVVCRSRPDTRAVAIEGPSGLLVALGLSRDCKQYNRSTGEIWLDNGAVIRSYAAESPDRLRGPNLAGAWCDELAAWRYEEAWTEGLMPALRIGDPRVVVTTTPRRTRLLKDLLARDDGTVFLTRGSTFDNHANLSAAALQELKRRYEGTRLGRQELEGELIEDVEGALWTRDMLEHRAFWGELPEPSNFRMPVGAAKVLSAPRPVRGLLGPGEPGLMGSVAPSRWLT